MGDRRHDVGHWIPVASEKLQDCRVFEVSRTHARSPRDGAVHPFHRIDSADWVNVVPVTEEGDIVMVRQYRHGSRRVSLEIPGGLVDPGEDPATAAVRELLEETGYAPSGEVELLGTVNPNPALFGNTTYTYLARAVQPSGDIQNSATEHTVVELIPRAQLRARLRAGEIDHSLVVSALYWFELAQPDT